MIGDHFFVLVTSYHIPKQKSKKLGYFKAWIFHFIEKRIFSGMPSGKIYIQLLFLFLPQFLHPQQNGFVNYTIEDGLIQSQVNFITQDSSHHLWIGTAGGLSKFDGTKFTSYTRSNGLLSNNIYNIITDKKGNIWCGTDIGLSFFDGQKFKNFSFGVSGQSNFVYMLRQDIDGGIWALAGLKLYTIKNEKAITVPVIQDSAEKITAINTDRKGILHACVLRKGIFSFSSGKWIKLNFPELNHQIIIRLFFDHNNKLWVFTDKNFYKEENGTLIPVKEGMYDHTGGYFIQSIEEDKDGNIWIGTDKGVLKITGTTSEYFDESKGLTSYAVYSIFKDVENNIWFGTDGDGIFRYTKTKFRRFEDSKGYLKGVILGIAKDKAGDIWMGTYTKGLVKYNGHNFSYRSIPGNNPLTERINSLFCDKDDNLWVGTFGGGVWKYANGKFERIFLKATGFPLTANSIWQDMNGITWITAPEGCYYINDHELIKIKDFDEPCFATQQAGKDSIIIACAKGLFMYTSYKKLQPVANKLLATTYAQCLAIKGDSIITGTNDKGLLIWDRKTGTVTNYNSLDGLSSDFIYSILPDHDTIWTGTGIGINKIILNNNSKKINIISYSQQQGLTGLESSLGTLIKNKENEIWIGTNKGVFIYDNRITFSQSPPPSLVLQSVKLDSRRIEKGQYTDSLSGLYSLPQHLILPTNKNNLVFEFRGIRLADPANIQYSYKLEGLGDEFSKPATAAFVVYPSLPSGNFVFKVKAIDSDGRSSNIVEFPFTIITPFYKTAWFFFILVAALILSGVLLQVFIQRAKRQREVKLEIVRLQEQQKIKQRTSEDFHDELGNRLTRISLLADILEKDTATDEMKKRLLTQIRENTTALYTGTKDILWSLSDKSNSLAELMGRLNTFGMELFQDSGTLFIFHEPDAVIGSVLLPMDYSRNILMIFKEAMNNCLRHAECSRAEINIDFFSDPGKIKIALTDNGKGFDPFLVKKGYGLDNMQKRSERIGAMLTINPIHIKGTVVELKFTINSRNHEPPNYLSIVL